MSYSEEFMIALERTSRFNLALPEGVEEVSRRIMNDKRIRHLNRVLAPVFEGIVSYEQMVGQCMPLHLKARPILEEWLGCPVYYTLGWVDDGTPKGVYKFDEDFITAKLKDGHQNDTINLHAWLTLPSMEVIDLTLSTTFAILQGYPEEAGGVLVKKADEFTGFAYKPMLVGEEFLIKSGLLKVVTWFE
jgi:hypothetical protein